MKKKAERPSLRLDSAPLSRPMLGRELWIASHWFGCKGNCPGCQVAFNYNLWRRFCHCGEPATGYRATAADSPVEFFCDEHFQGLPESAQTVDAVDPVGEAVTE